MARPGERAMQAIARPCPNGPACINERCPYQHPSSSIPAIPGTVQLTEARRCKNDDCDRCAPGDGREFCCSSCKADFDGSLGEDAPMHDPWCRNIRKFKVLTTAEEIAEAMEASEACQEVARKHKRARTEH
eukprot:TRINITY_DN59526_c0_g1_i1.p1 TRINITY_DN59526_c0_g1~~TRINITY_DN59526_c0_g1_i1.p1  ORF type:complete len:153 (+),score=7.54 TRINITY_DN59526_c0_g1_i1:67-459(+)